MRSQVAVALVLAVAGRTCALEHERSLTTARRLAGSGSTAASLTDTLTCLARNGAWSGDSPPYEWTYSATDAVQPGTQQVPGNAALRPKLDCDEILMNIEDAPRMLKGKRIAIVGDSTSREVFRDIAQTLAKCEAAPSTEGAEGEEGEEEQPVSKQQGAEVCALPPKFHEGTVLFKEPRTAAPGVLPGAMLGDHFGLTYFGLQQMRDLVAKPWFPSLFWFVNHSDPSTAPAYAGDSQAPLRAYAAPPAYDLIVLNSGLWNLRHDADVYPKSEARMNNLVKEVHSFIRLLTESPERAAIARRTLVWRSMTPVEHSPGVTVRPFTATDVLAVNKRIAAAWRDAGFGVLDSAKFLQHATKSPDSKSASKSTVLTRDGIHPLPTVNLAMARELLSALAVTGTSKVCAACQFGALPTAQQLRAGLPADPLLPFNEPLHPAAGATHFPAYVAVWGICAAVYWLLQRGASKKPSSRTATAPAAPTPAHAPRKDAQSSEPAPSNGDAETRNDTGASALPQTAAGDAILSSATASGQNEIAVLVEKVAPPPAAVPSVARSSAAAPLDVSALTIAAVALVTVSVLCLVFDRWHWFPIVNKIKPLGPDLYITFVMIATLIAFRWSLHTAPESSKADDVLMSLSVTEETKGWMMFLLLAYHYYDVKAVYNFMRMLVAAYLWLTGYGNTLSLKKTPPTLAKFGLTFLRLNLLCACMVLATGEPWMLYYICPLHTVWALFTVLLHWKRDVSPVVRYGIAAVLVTLIWHIDIIFDAVFVAFQPMLMYKGSMYEWRFRSKLDCYATILGCIFAECREYIMPYLTLTPGAGENVWQPRVRIAAIASACAGIMAWYASSLLAMPDRFAYNKYHPYLSPFALMAFVILRGCTGYLRRTHSKLFAFMGKHSLELYLLQFHLWLSGNAKFNVVPFPTYRFTSLLVQSMLFMLCAMIAFQGVSTVLAALRDRPRASVGALAVCCAALSFSIYFDNRNL